ncbi:MobV family relaxase [Priestia megaterium]|uniref:MobV family relaxase n=1 Tax=Priestia megaterium TaxID=1404 RepID=UPI003009420D
MSFAIIRMQKFKAPDVKGMQIHNYREKESHTNPDIDQNKTALNYDLLNDSKIEFSEAIQREIDERYTGQKTIRKDAVRLCEFVVTSDRDFFDKLSPEDEKRFFKESLSFLQERYGKENMLYGIVHRDEKTPHMHVGMVPITNDGKLAAKQFFGKKTELQQLQTKFHEHVTEKGFDLERGVSSDRKHIETQRLKALTAQEQVKALENELKQKQQEKQVLNKSIEDTQSRLSEVKKSLDKVPSFDDLQIKTKGGLFRSETIEMPARDFENIKALAQGSESLREENKLYKSHNFDLMGENANLKQQLAIVEKDREKFKRERDELRKENQKLEKKLSRTEKLLQKVHELYKRAGLEHVQSFERVLGFAKHQINKTLDVFKGDELFAKKDLSEDEVKGFNTSIRNSGGRVRESSNEQEREHGPEM